MSSGTGIYYSKDGLILKSVTSKDQIEISRNCQEIYGKSENDYAFKESVSTIRSFTFQSDPQLVKVQCFAFYMCSQLQAADFSQCTKLKYIENNAFYQCERCKTVIFPNSLQEIGDSAFQQSGVTEIVFPASLTLLEIRSFGYSKLNKITFEKGIKIKDLKWRTFSGVTLDTVTIPASVETFEATCFEHASISTVLVDPDNKNFTISGGLVVDKEETIVYYCPKNREACTFPSTVVRIKNSAFASSKVKSIQFPEKLGIIEPYAFNMASALTEITIPSTVTYIGESAFRNVYNLGSVTFEEPAKVKVLEPYTFANCNLVDLTLPDSITEIQNNCFQENNLLATVKLPANLSSLGGGVFSNCAPNIQLDLGEKFMIDQQYIIMDKQQTYINQFIGESPNTTIQVPESISIIKSSSFAGKSNLIEVKLTGNKLKQIEKYAFKNCANLASINLPDSVELIDEEAFKSCSKLTAINLKGKVQQIGINAFENCMLISSVTTSDSLSQINKQVFYNCFGITDFVIGSNVESIGKQAFFKCTSLTRIVFPKSVISFGVQAFELSGLQSISFEPESLINELGELAFFKATSLAAIENFPPLCTVIGVQCFDGTAFASFTIPDQVVEIKKQCFKNCKNLVSFSIPETSSLSTIGISIFSGCDSLKEVTAKNLYFADDNGGLFTLKRDKMIFFPPASEVRFFAFPSNVKTIDYGALENCRNLELILIPENSVQTIGQKAFHGCVNLKNINIPACVTNVFEDAFLGCKNIQCGQIIGASSTTIEQLLAASFPSKAINHCVKETIRPCYYPRLISNTISLYIGLLISEL